jgi:hypothetical protein
MFISFGGGGGQVRKIVLNLYYNFYRISHSLMVHLVLFIHKVFILVWYFEMETSLCDYRALCSVPVPTNRVSEK